MSVMTLDRRIKPALWPYSPGRVAPEWHWFWESQRLQTPRTSLPLPILFPIHHGKRLLDARTRAYDSVVTGAADDAGRVGRAIKFTGSASTEYVDIAGMSGLGAWCNNGSFTILMLADVSAHPGAGSGYTVIGDADAAGANWSFEVVVDNDSGTWRLFCYTTGIIFSVSAAYALNKVQALGARVARQGGVTYPLLFVDGQFSTAARTTSANALANGTDTQIGRWGAYAAQAHKGRVYQLSIFPWALTNEQIIQWSLDPFGPFREDRRARTSTSMLGSGGRPVILDKKTKPAPWGIY